MLTARQRNLTRLIGKTGFLESDRRSDRISSRVAKELDHRALLSAQPRRCPWRLSAHAISRCPVPNPRPTTSVRTLNLWRSKDSAIENEEAHAGHEPDANSAIEHH